MKFRGDGADQQCQGLEGPSKRCIPATEIEKHMEMRRLVIKKSERQQVKKTREHQHFNNTVQIEKNIKITRP